MRNFTFLFVFVFLFGFINKTTAQGGAGIVENYGRLQVSNAHVCAEDGTPVTLGGMSLFWICFSDPIYYTAETVNYMVDNFKISYLRIPFGCIRTIPEDMSKYLPRLKTVIEACIARGIYVNIDWHVEGDNLPYENEEIKFFQSMVEQYGKYNNVMYELWSEPTQSTTPEIQGLCQRVTNAIRAKESQLGLSPKLVICGSKNWSQNPQSYKINDTNAAYSLHLFADQEPSHLNLLQTSAQPAMDMGNAIIVTEYAVFGCKNLNTPSVISWCQNNKISMSGWNVSDKVNSYPGEPLDGIFTSKLDGLNCVGQFFKNKITTWPTIVTPKIYPTSVLINQSTTTLFSLGYTNELSVSFSPLNTTQTNVTWTSSNPEIVSVTKSATSSTGIVKAVSEGTAYITVTATDINGGRLMSTCTVIAEDVSLLSLNKPITASSIESNLYTANFANDLNPSSRWSSAASDPQWIQIDLGGIFKVSNILLNWEAASAKDYTIQISADSITWNTISSQFAKPNGSRLDNLFVNGTGRYIKMIGTARTTTYGYSLFNFEVFGKAALVVHPTGINLYPDSASMDVGGIYQFTPKFTPSNTTNQALTWKSSNTALANVSNAGLVTAISEGTVLISCTTADGGLVDASVMRISRWAVKGISISPLTAQVGINESTQLVATLTPNNATNKNVNWSSSNSAIASVSASGLVTGKAVGNASITATTLDGGFLATCSITVANTWFTKIEAETFSSKSNAPALETCSDLGAGQNVGYIGNNDYLNYNVNVPTTGTYTITFRVASVNATGQIVLRTNGADISNPISISNTGGWQNWTTITTTAYLAAGANTYTLFAKTGGFNINWWNIAGGTISTVSATGVSVSPASLSLAIGANSSLVATVAPANATNKNVTWTSSNTAIATVNATGVLTAIAAGSAVITAKTVDGAFTSSCSVTVTGSVFTPIHIEAETYNTSGAGNGGNIQKEACSDTNGGQDVAYISAGCWFAFPVITIPQTATYTVSYRLASPNSGLSFNLSTSNTTLDANVPVPNTGGWQNWQTVSRQVALTAGTYSLAFGYFTGALNINWLEISNPVKSSALSTENTTAEASVRVFPNPTESELHIESTTSNINEIAIYTLSGLQIEKFSLNAVETYNVNVGALASGMYIISITTQNSISTQKFIKK